MKVCTTCGVEYADDKSFCPADGSALKSTAGAADLVGSIVADRYRILSKLGEGGMGAVYLSEHVKMGRKSAIKVMAKSMAQDPDAIARFNREAANAARINHPNVCSIYDFGETDDGVIYLAMEFIEGVALTDLIEREGALPPQRAADIIRQTGEALDAAHELGIVHRDLKPDNIMVGQARDGSDFIKVVDFGIAKAVGGDQEQNVTRTGLVVGTPEYMSPEQLSGDKVDGRSDIYSLSLVAFRTLTGTLPFQADSAQEVMIKRLTDEPLKLHEALPSGAFPPALQAALDRGLQRMPGDRYAHASELGRDVTQAASGMAAPDVDVEGATQVIDAGGITDQSPAVVEGPTAAIPGTRISGQAPSADTPDTPVHAAEPVAPPGPRKKAPVGAIAAVAGAVVIGGVGAVVMIGGGGEDLAPPDTAQIARDSVTGNTETGAETGEGSRPEGGQPADTAGRGGTRLPPADESTTRDTVTTSVAVVDSTPTAAGGTPDPETANPSWISLDGADDHLVDLMLRLEDPAPNLPAIRDTATAYYNAVGITATNKALAAFVTAQAIGLSGDRLTALDWARRARDLEPSNRSYQTMVTELERGGGA